ncbi:MAG: efflux transporter periplasmic adaptor subunit [Stappia sp.]|uniref:efflux RND transporter periplasmic adaptor subunit n=1 Tax=Stappia sp. TaxID=1870903 RepID=UPI000C51474D|nr:efflux RND transporter periplasmic adaptor subunit [Stappia sp.]MAA97888.1 efflux transporter periplasmic adaptor subunit [Stappia sp.]MBM19698.1 efflux transporter periplasmic adaptor subunit [Stappia sp.]
MNFRACLLALPALALAGPLLVTPALAASLTVAREPVTEWKALYGQVEARDQVPARARIGGTIAELAVEEGDTVTAGERIATVADEKITFQIAALDARLRALQSQLENAEADLSRAETLVERGVVTRQRLDQLRTSAEVTRNEIAATSAERSVIVRQGEEGDVLAPADGRVLTVPVTRGAVIMPGETLAILGSGGTFLRLSIPERHAGDLKDGAEIRIGGTGAGEAPLTGRLAKVYPTIQSGRVVADVDVDSLDTQFINARVLVRVPVGTREAILVPARAVTTRAGLDFVKVASPQGPVERTVLTGATLRKGEESRIEILSGLMPGDEVILP